MDYRLLKTEKAEKKKASTRAAFAKMIPLLARERNGIVLAFVMVLLTSGFNLLGPLVVGHAVDRYVSRGDYRGVLVFSGLLLGLYLIAFLANYVQMRAMGAVAQKTLWRLRNDLFAKLQSLPLAFFNQNKSGDLISRINTDTEKLNNFFSQGLMRFAGNVFLIIGAGIFILFINFKLAVSALLPAAVIFVFSRLAAGWVARTNAESSRAVGLLSAEIQESIANFKVVLAFNRRDYFRERFETASSATFKAAVRAGVANELFTPVFELMGNIAQLVVLGVGLYLIAQGQFALGLLVSFVLYITRFYDPLREMARLWATFQTALASWDRIDHILGMGSDINVVPSAASDDEAQSKGLLEFRGVGFGYPDGGNVLSGVNFVFEKGKTYALVGPTGGGKTTTASLIARLYDPTEGTVYLDGRDIRSYESTERAKRIGFILQDPFLFVGSIGDNIKYGNEELEAKTDAELESLLRSVGLDKLISRFEKGLATKVDQSGSLSLGERQIIAFVRAVLRKPDILILDEATANIDTVTEKILDDILAKLPKTTTKVVIAHRLNTIANADDIFFVNGGEVTEAGSMEHAVEMLLHGKRAS